MQTLITCHRCRARVELTTDGRGHLIERRTECTCPPMTEAERAELRRCWKCGERGVIAAGEIAEGLCGTCARRPVQTPKQEKSGVCQDCERPLPEGAHYTTLRCRPCAAEAKRRQRREHARRSRRAGRLMETTEGGHDD